MEQHNNFIGIIKVEPNIIPIIEKYLSNNDKLHLFNTSKIYSRIRSMITTYTYDDFILDKTRKKMIIMFDLFMLFGSLDLAFSALHSKTHTRLCDVLINKGAIRFIDCWACISQLFVL
jgi:hypothetical protein